MQSPPSTNSSSQQLPRSLGALMLWGLGVGYVISGMYFGWNLGLAQGGTGGLAIATLFIIILYWLAPFQKQGVYSTMQ
jgi:ethanolamine permease